MKRNFLLIAAFVGGLLFASCGENKDATFMKEADDMFSQAETELQGIDNLDDFCTLYANLLEQKSELAQKMMEAYAVDDTSAKVPDEVSQHIYNRATEYNKVEAEKFAELFTPLLDELEAAVEAKDKAAVESAFEAIIPYANYDNVVPELQERYQVIQAGLIEMGIIL